MIFRNSDGAASRCGGQKVVYSTMRGNSSYRSKDIHQFGYWQREISVMELLSASRTLDDGSDDAWVRLGWSCLGRYARSQPFSPSTTYDYLGTYGTSAS